MNLFRRKPKVLSPRTAEAAERWVNILLLRQRQVADWLGRKTAYWDKASKIIALCLFCLVFGGISLWLLLKTIL
ncbi:hypothetical protein [Mucilaginibacter paludis]|uniref:Uncharacterized protein n=1 Tax=Mucilaginibacter paludis DSM 18603 TaxID=714943 RepID=H1Y154_9SPHI|nr:hypothetical protein [Mucilaginibacter paludis]EHQ29689.1 hypothetical protein Mucpa_5620 [Mucilaginibacter paludis DSM 18603]